MLELFVCALRRPARDADNAATSADNSQNPVERKPRRLRELEQENAKLKRLLAEAELDKAALKDLLHRKL